MSAISEELNYQIVEARHPDYKLVKLAPNEAGSITSSTSGGQTTTFVVQGNKPVNLARSKLNFDVAFPASTAGSFAYMWLDAISEIASLEVETDNGVKLLKLDHFNKYSQTVLKAVTSMEEIRGHDKVIPNLTAATSTGKKQGLQLLNGSPLAFVDGVAAGFARSDNTVPTAFGDEAGYINKSVTAKAGVEASAYSVSLDLGQLKGTIFEIDKDILFRSNLNFIITWAKSTDIFFETATVPSIAAAADITTGVTISNAAMLIATEQNPEIIRSLQDAKSLEILMPVTRSAKVSATSTSVTVNARVSSADGQNLLSVVCVPNHTVESKNTTYSHDNIAQLRVLTVDVQHNNNSIRGYTLNEAKKESWAHQKEYLNGSQLGLSSDVFYFNYMMIQDFSGRKHSSDPINSRVGLPLSGPQQTISFALTTDAALATNYYTFITSQRSLVLTPMGPSF